MMLPVSPANLTPDYEKAEQRYRAATTDEERLDGLRDMLSKVPKHKGTEKIQADIKRRISQLRKAEAKKGPTKGVDPFRVQLSGAGQVVLLGAPNVGKSALLVRCTNASAKVADYPFTTGLPAPGMWPHQDVQIQLVDTPPVTPDHVPGGMFGTLRSADILGIVVDAVGQPLEEAETVLGLLSGRGLDPRTVPLNELDREDPAACCALLVANKSDLGGGENVDALRELYAGRLEVWPASAATGLGLEALRERLWQLLAVIRVYTKQPGHPPDNDKPFILGVGSTVEDLAHDIHRELPGKMKFARIWGDGRHSGQQVARGETLHDRDTVEIHE